MITAIVTFVLLLALGYIIFVHSGKQEGVNKTIGYVVIGVIAVAVIAIPVFALARGIGGREDFTLRGPQGRPGMQGGMYAPGQPWQGQGGRLEDFGGCPQGGMQQCPQPGDNQGCGRGSINPGREGRQQFRGMPYDGQGMPRNWQQPPQGLQNPGTQPRMNPPGSVNPQPGNPNN